MSPATPAPRGSRARTQAEVDDEFAFHLELAAAQLRQRGWSDADATAEARRQFGDLEHARAYCVDQDIQGTKRRRRMTTIDELSRDVRFAWRSLRGAPVFTATVLLTLALGIGANTAIFSVVRAVLLQPLPFAHPEQLVRVWTANPTDGVAQGALSAPDFLDWRSSATASSSMAGYFFADGLTGVDLTGDADPQRLSATLVTDGFFETLGTPPLLGRTFRADDQLDGRNRVVVLSHALWQSRFNGDRGVIDGRIVLNGQPFTVVGVMPPSFMYPATASLDAWIPLSFFGPDDIGRVRGAGFLSVIARLRAGASGEALRDELSRINADLRARYPDNTGWTSATVMSIRESIVGEIERPLTLLMGAVALVLLLTCINVASLLLTRATARQRELAVRAALGAGRGRIVRQLLTECLMLAFGGSILGIGFAVLAVRALVWSGATELPRASAIAIDLPVLAFALGASVLAGLIFGLLPALRAAGAAMEAEVRSSSRGTVSRSGGTLRSALVTTQVALALVLIAAAGLTVKSLTRLLSVNLGFDPAHALVIQMSIPDRYASTEQRTAYYEGVLQNLRELPGVTAVGAVRDLPLRGNGESRRPELAGRAPGDGPIVQLHHISRDYFAAMRIALKQGRAFTLQDGAGAPPVMIINEALAQRFFPGQNAVGQKLRFGRAEVPVVGVVADVHQRGPSEPADPALYVHYHQQGRSRMSIVVRTSGDPLALTASAKAAIWSLDPMQTISRVTTLENEVGLAITRPRLIASLLVLFGVLGLVLGALGLYGVLAFSVNQRRREIGVRVALGASPGSVSSLVVRHGLRITLIGAGAGMLVVLVLGRALQSVLYDVSAHDVTTLVATTSMLVAVALVASWIPARRASNIDPAEALRSD